MRHIRVPSLDELVLLESEVNDELIDGAETSFTTQRKVYQFLINDYEAVNASLSRELHLYRTKATNQFLDMKREVECMRIDVSRMDEENRQLHELLIYFGNQLNDRVCTCVSTSSSSISEEYAADSSGFLDNLVSKLRVSSVKSVDEVNENVPKLPGGSSFANLRDCVNPSSSNDMWDEETENLNIFWLTLFPLLYCLSMDIHRTESGIARYPEYIGEECQANNLSSMDESVFDYSLTSVPNTESDSELTYTSTPSTVITTDSNDSLNNESYDEVVQFLRENILLKDKLLQHMEKEIEDQAQHIEYLVKQATVFSRESVRDEHPQITPCDRGLRSNGEIFPQPRIDYTISNETDRNQPLIPFVAAMMPSKAEKSSNTSTADAYNGVNIGKWEKHTKGFGSRYLKGWNYEGKGLGKNGDGIINPVEIKPQQTFGLNDKGDVKSCVQNNTFEWPPDTTLIIGDSIILGVIEDKLKKYRTKIRPFKGARIDDLYDYIAPLLRKKPTNVIIHVGTNDAVDKDAKDIFCELLRLKDHIEDELPGAKVIISCPTLRVDNGKANRTLQDLNNKLIKLAKHDSTYELIPNKNVIGSMIGKRGLHLNKKGSDRIAKNFIGRLQCL